MKKIVPTGGGTAGHVTLNITLLPAPREAGYEVLYISSYEGTERKLTEAAGTPYCGIFSGKLRRYSDWKNSTDLFRVLKGYGEVEAILRDLRSDLIFSKGGYVVVPVVRVVKCLGTPAVVHESDMTPGLANCLSCSMATKICRDLPETLSPLLKDKVALTSSPIRAELLSGSCEAAYERIGFTPERPVLLVIDDSLSSRVVNASVRKVLPDLLKEFQVLHIAGKNSLGPTLSETPGYRQSEYAFEELKDYFALADIMVSRAGANAIREIFAFRKPNVLTPFSTKANRGGQTLNVCSYERQGHSRVLEEEALPRETLLAAVRETYVDRARYLVAMEAGGSADSVAQVVSVPNSVTAGRR